MKNQNRRQKGRPATELIEEAVHLLRHAPAGALAVYLAGTLPFLLGLLFFCADMGHNPHAPRHEAEASLGLAVLFLWMKFWQSVFTGRLRAHVAGQPAPRLDFLRCRRIFSTQTALQPFGLIILPVALLATVPLPWAYAFYQNLTVLADAEVTGLTDLSKKAWRQALLWPAQNSVLLTILSGFGFFVFLNWTFVCYTLPDLAKMLFGIETVFSRSGPAMLNTTFFAAMFSLTYLCVDPILKAVYVLRCFYGESVQSGEDLKAQLRQFSAAPQRALGLALVLFFAGTLSLSAADAPPAPATPVPAPTPAVSPPELDKAIQETIDQTKYAWRMPREKVARKDSEQQGVIGRFFDKLGTMLRKWARAVLDWIEKWRDKMRPKAPHGSPGDDSGYGWIMVIETLLYGLLAAVIIGLVWMLYRAWHNRRRPPEPVAAQAIQAAPDLRDENTGADQLPEDGWIKLANELLAKGELRLALRAFYLASLAHLAQRNLISLARFKSNHDYERELGRRAHALPDVLTVFGENVSIFDRIWYGMHEVSADIVTRFAANVDHIKTVG